MAIKTYEQQLEEVQAAIEKAENAQLYEINTGGISRSITRATIFRLYEREKYLRRMVDREKSGGIPVKYGVPPK